MPSSTRKWIKRQKEYERRKRQATRRRNEETRAREEQRKKNLTSAALGVTAAQGFGKNILSKLLETSKYGQSNYLLNTLRKKRMNNAQAKFFKNYKKEINGSKLHYAIKKEDPFAVKLMLADTDLALKDLSGRTPLQATLIHLLSILEEPIEENIWYSARFQKRVEEKERRIEAMMKIYDLLVKAGARIGLEEYYLLWSSPSIGNFLDLYPELVQPSYFYQEEIKRYLKNKLRRTQNEMYEEAREFHRGDYGGYGFVPLHLQRQEENEENAIRVFKLFVDSFDTNTGSYRLTNKYNSEDDRYNQND